MTVLRLIKKIDHKGFSQVLMKKIQDMTKAIGIRITKIQDLEANRKLTDNRMETEEDMTEDTREVQNFLIIHTWAPLKVGHDSKMIHIRTSRSRNHLETGKLSPQEAKVRLSKQATSQKALIKLQIRTIIHPLKVITPLKNLANRRVILSRRESVDTETVTTENKKITEEIEVTLEKETGTIDTNKEVNDLTFINQGIDKVIIKVLPKIDLPSEDLDPDQNHPVSKNALIMILHHKVHQPDKSLHHKILPATQCKYQLQLPRLKNW